MANAAVSDTAIFPTVINSAMIRLLVIIRPTDTPPASGMPPLRSWV